MKGNLLKNRYQLQKKLGRGGNARTFLALDRETNQQCVVKTFALQKVEEWKAIELFEREAKILKHLKHPNIPQYIDYFTSESSQTVHYFLVQAYVPGKNLADWIADGRHFTEEEVLKIAMTVAKVLKYLQSFSPQIIHRDIKPHNILLTPDNQVYLIDFGAVQDQLKIGGGSTIVGTFGYIAPEQAKGKVVPASDIYALGVSLIHVLSHIPPDKLEDQNMRLQFKSYLTMSKAFMRVLEKMVEPDYRKRYPTATELLTALNTVRSAKQGRDSQVPLPLFARYVLASLLALVVMGGIGLGVAKFLMPRQSPPVVVSTPPQQSQESLPVINTPTEASRGEPSEVVAMVPVATELPQQPKAAAENSIKTPDLIADAVVAGGGKWVVLKMETMPVLAVYDADTQNIVKLLRLPSANFLYAAGGDKVLIYYPENNLLQTWDLNSFQQLKTKPNPTGAVICRLTMGHSNNSLALVRYATGTQALDNAGTYFLDVATLENLSASLPKEQGARGLNSSYRDFIHQRADSNLRYISEWATSHSPSGIGLLIRTEYAFTSRYEHDTQLYLAMGDDNRIYTQQGGIYNLELREVGRIQGHKLIPGIGGALFLSVAKDGNMQVYASGSTTPISPSGQFPGLDPNAHPMEEAWAKTPFVFDRHIIFDPSHNRLLLIPFSHDQILQRAFDLKAFMKQAGVDYLVVMSAPDTSIRAGQSWTYQMQVLSNAQEITYQLESGPTGMSVDSKGLLKWNVPANAQGMESVVILIKNKAGESRYHSFDLVIE
jgi:serine/threonine protein kinase